MASLRVSLPLLLLLMIVGAFGTEWSVKYNQQKICALKGSTVFMNGTFTHPGGQTVTEVFWVMDPDQNPSWPDMSKNADYSGRVEYLTDEWKHFSLNLNNVMKKDEHQYCVRIKTDQEKQKYLGRPGVTLTVTELHVETPGEVTEGETADLTCKTTCSLTDPTFIWYKNGHPLTTKTINNNQLHLQTVSSEDAGSYSCAVRGYQHLHSTAQNLRVRYPPKNVSVSIRPSGEIMEGSSVTLTCSSDANPPVKNYTWIKGSTSVGEGKTYSIPNIRSEDSGEYTCQSRNDHGERRSAAVQLNVLYPPKNVSVSISPSGEIVEGSSVTLTCSSDANPPAKNYTWFKEGGTSPVGSGQNYSIISITADHTGLYCCVAQNEHGAQRTAGVPVSLKGYPVILYVAVGVGLCFIFLVFLTVVLWRRRKKQDENMDQPIYANEGEKDHSPPLEDKSSVYANVVAFKKQH
ncbi:B-cell receptor CD22-like isoform X2 [Colossoma macropomum]|uniref:B-cell receptor CD22-like isoform X2 n=1 Tax=Colossoma macropomum TaxID=42526 RepID=UPI001863AF94|nr:B-cell receptor CD22-like isoform X2 [Colossoma macropomum]